MSDELKIKINATLLVYALGVTGGLIWLLAGMSGDIAQIKAALPSMQARISKLEIDTRQLQDKVGLDWNYRGP